MNFYHAYYKRQVYDAGEDCWEDTDYNCQGIVVIASNYDEAKVKVEKCLPIVETEQEWGKYRAVLVSDIVECIGLDRRLSFDGGFEVFPIF